MCSQRSVRVALLGVLLAATLSRRLTGHAAVVADRVAAGDLDARVDAEGNDEIAPLGEAIDGMASALGLERLAHRAAVTVRDHGTGYPEQLLREGPRQFAGGGGPDAPATRAGTGLGLVIAHAQALAVGARLTLANAPDVGAEATLRLTAGE